jgi:carbon-monoxide dehydrogenase small subunit
MISVTITVNGRQVHASVEPRMQLADFLREELGLTGTHLGCEQGVCGACTILLDGAPARSCIAYAVDCAGGEIRTIEGFETDPIMAELREAFAAHHGLQCGFCTPGMLITGHDIVTRLGEIPEQRIREELSGNLCRCTGYVGIVAAIRSVVAGKAPVEAAQPPAPASAERAQPAAPPPLAKTFREEEVSAPRTGATTITEIIPIAAPPDIVWKALADLPRVAACLPGAEITTIDGDRFTGRMRLGLGPIGASFTGRGQITRDEAALIGRMAGSGRDSGTGSNAQGEAGWRVLPGDNGGSILEVTLRWRLSGALAQFNRTGLVQDVIRRLAASFAANLQSSLTGAPPALPRKLSLLGLLWSVLKARLSGRFRTEPRR